MKTIDNDFEPEQFNVSEIRSLDILIREYPNEKVIPQFKKLQQAYPFHRPVRGDGNCFYRAMAFLYLREANLNHFSNVFEKIQNNCTGYPLEFESISFQHKLHQLYQDFLVPLRDTSLINRQNGLAQYFNKSIVFDTVMIIYFRSLNYQYLRVHSDQFRQFIIDFNQTVQKVRRYGNYSEGTEYLSMAKALNIQLQIKITDESRLNSETYNIIHTRPYQLFFRPGHFDILYHKDSPYLSKKKTQLYSYNHSTRNYQSNSYEQHNNNEYYRFNQPQRQFQQFSSVNSKNYFPQVETDKLSQMQEKQKHSSNVSSPFMSLSNLRSTQPKQKNKLTNLSKKQPNKHQKLTESNVFQSKNSVPTQKYKAWQQDERNSQGGTLKKIKQALIISMFLTGLGFVFYII